MSRSFHQSGCFGLFWSYCLRWISLVQQVYFGLSADVGPIVFTLVYFGLDSNGELFFSSHYVKLIRKK